MRFNQTKYNANWNDKKLNELGTFNRGKSKHRPRNDAKLFKNGIYPLIQTGDIKDANLYINNHSQSYNDFGLSQSKLWEQGTLCITIAANIAETGILKYPMCFPDSVVGFKSYPSESSEKFMHYVFTYIRKAIQNSICGSIQDNINIEYLENLRFKIPPKKYQDKVADTLSSLDAKIELNNTMNSELEAMAKTLYDYWFVQFDFPNEEGKPYKSSGGAMVYSPELKREIPKGWKVKALGEVCDLYQPKTISEKELITGGNYSVYGANGVIGRYDKYNHEHSMIAIACRGNSCGTINITEPFSWITGNAMVVNPKNFNFSILFLYHTLNIFGVHTRITGSAQPQITRSNLENILIYIPSDFILKKFNNITIPKHQLIQKNLKQNQHLASLRDFLLPMLMNGQVGVV